MAKSTRITSTRRVSKNVRHEAKHRTHVNRQLRNGDWDSIETSAPTHKFRTFVEAE
jgi:hypothetical protein